MLWLLLLLLGLLRLLLCGHLLLLDCLLLCLLLLLVYLILPLRRNRLTHLGRLRTRLNVRLTLLLLVLNICLNDCLPHGIVEQFHAFVDNLVEKSHVFPLPFLYLDHLSVL